MVNKCTKAGTSLGELVTVYLTIEMLRIVEATHDVGIIHADIKPDNFLITKMYYFICLLVVFDIWMLILEFWRHRTQRFEP